MLLYLAVAGLAVVAIYLLRETRAHCALIHDLQHDLHEVDPVRFPLPCADPNGEQL